ncbi:MAG TPA: TRIC cation channel family protein, partial [Thiolinea sp.]|nr:TRIC cation channel family protein [Thiolinea sp.]
MFEWVVTGLNIMATMVLAISGVSQAARQRMDFFGALVLACVCALGGGSLRDLLIGATPVFWTRDLTYLAVILPTTVVTILVVQYIPPGRGIRLRILD